jgi:hypothetical protein
MAEKYYVIRATTDKETKEYYFKAADMDFEITSGQIRNDYKHLLNGKNKIALELQKTTSDLYYHHTRKTIEQITEGKKKRQIEPRKNHLVHDGEPLSAAYK